MVKRNNKGFSLVEVIIAAAVFAILIYPITTALVSATKTGTMSTKKQYAVEKAEEIMEIFKSADVKSAFDATTADDLKACKVEVPNGTKTAAYTFTAESKYDARKIKLPEGSGDADYTSVTYSCKDIAIGTSYEKYPTCTVEINDAAYQVMKKGYILKDKDASNMDEMFKKTNGDSKFQKIDTGGTGTVRNLDSSKYAVIVGATYNSAAELNNLDNLAYQYFLDDKVSLIRNYDVLSSQYDSGADIFDADAFSKNTTIQITKDKVTNIYTVTCNVEYTDTTKISAIKTAYEAKNADDRSLNTYRPSTQYGEGVVYKQQFKDELPVIYFLYIPAIYNGRFNDTNTEYYGKYNLTDTITVDNTDISDEMADIYIFQSSRDIKDSYNDVIVKQLAEKFNVKRDAEGYPVDESNVRIPNKKFIDSIRYSNSNSNIKMEDVKVNLKLMGTTPSQKVALAKNLDIYANFNFDSSSEYTVKSMSEDDSDDVYMYEITVTLTDSKGNKTTVTGTRGK
ncbi:MAG: prepilin-type N-terminal cleavage/methylation domain-containing protein [Clostridiales bacterium]|nr:prepilin-type N-terminal cleavage/methylation domain-containing protein [Clostridiales bacterium]